jgi:hypothetical protein
MLFHRMDPSADVIISKKTQEPFLARILYPDSILNKVWAFGILFYGAQHLD